MMAVGSKVRGRVWSFHFLASTTSSYSRARSRTTNKILVFVLNLIIIMPDIGRVSRTGGGVIDFDLC